MENKNQDFINKTLFMKVQQCTKAGYLLYNHPEFKTDNPYIEAAINKKDDIKKYLKLMFPMGITVSYDTKYSFGDPDQFRILVEFTKFIVEKPTRIIYDGCFQSEDKRCLIDILNIGSKTWKVFEIKTTTSIEDEHILELAFKVNTLKACYPKAKIEAFIIHLNKEYVRHESLVYEQLFEFENVTQRIRLAQPLVERYSQLAKKVLGMDQVPQTSIGTKCSIPHECEFKNHCWKNIPENSVFDISRLWEIKKFKLYDQGIVSLEDIPRKVKLNEKQWMQIDCTVQNRNVIDPLSIKEFLKDINYPIYFMDFETVMPAIPRYPNTSPYSHVPFQFSVHMLESENSELEHFEFLHEDVTDPRIPFLDNLLSVLEDSGTVFVYNKKFEEARLRELGKVFPKYKVAIDNVIGRIKDMMVPFEERYLYHPGQKGSVSLKVVLPVWVPGLSYKDLAVNNGGGVGDQFEKIVFFRMPIENREQLKRDLLEYCKMDTYALARLLSVLQDIVAGYSGEYKIVA